MKTLNLKPLFSFFLITSLSGFANAEKSNSQNAPAQKMSTDTQDLVIKKLERVISTLEPQDDTLIPSQQRLADLLSERARIRFMQEIEANCDGCKGSKADREKAIGLYESLLKTVNLKGDGLILFQLAHLYQMAGKNDKAQSLFENLLAGAKSHKTSRSIVTRAQAGLGDLLFQKGKFKEALKNYELALQNPELETRALVIYNKAWCEFNLEKLSLAITTLVDLLSHPEQITHASENGGEYDSAFHSDLLRDLATFYSKRDVTERDIQMFSKLVPSEKRKEILLHFATEVDRVGQKKAARSILDLYLKEPNLTKEEKLQALVMSAQVNYDGGQASQSTQDFAKAAAAYQDHGCDKSEDCAKLQKTMKHYVTELHRSKKLKPDADLLSAYGIYTKTFPEDKEMLQRAAQVSIEVGQWSTAVIYYRKISTNSSFSEKEREEALVNEVAAAEKSQNPAIQKESYLFFVSHSSNETKKFEVRYQLAYLAFQQKQYREASDAFFELAQDKKGSSDLRKKAADLSLDGLVHLKDEPGYEKRAWGLADIFPNFKNEFETSARKAFTNQAARVANNPQASNGEMKAFLNNSWNARLASANSQERVLIYTNAAVLAKRLNDQESFLKTQEALLREKSVTEKDRNQIYVNLAAYFEKKLDFKKAYKWAVLVQNKKVSPQEKEFRLGTLADLAEMNPEKHYRAALRLGMKDSRSLVIRSRLIALSSRPLVELKTQAPYLKKQPSLLNDIVLMVYAKTGNKKALQSLLLSHELKNKSAAHFILTQGIYDRIDLQIRKTEGLRFHSYTPTGLQKGLSERVKALNALDSLLKESVQLKDITAQMMTLDAISKQNKRLVQDLINVPQPKGLKPQELAQYQQILNSKLRPFLYKSKLAEHKRDEIWARSTALQALIQDYALARPEIQKLMKPQLTLLSQVEGEGNLKSQLKETLNTSTETLKDLASARMSVSENPEDKRQIENLKRLETKLGHPLMPGYLEARLNHLEKEKSL